LSSDGATRLKSGLSNASLPLIQLGAGFGGFAAWSVLSQSVTTESFGRASTVMAWGMAGYLPLTLGLPFMLGNFYRDRRHDDTDPRALWTIRLTVFSAVALATLGLLTALIGWAAPGTGWWPLVSGALCLAGLACSSVTLQQQARVHSKPSWMLWTTTLNLTLPFAWLVGTLATDALAAQALITGAGVAVSSLVQCAILVRSEPEALRAPLPVQPLRDALRSALPMIPHLLFFGVLMQGTRLALALRGADAEEVAEAASIMLVLGVGLAVVGGVHGVISTSLLRTATDDFARRFPGFAAKYAALGLTAALGIYFVILTGLTVVLDDMPDLSAFDTASMAAAPGGMTCYYLLSTLLVRVERTRMLAVVSGVAAVTYFGAAAAFSWSPLEALRAFAGVVLVLHLAVLPIVTSRSPLSYQQILRGVFVSWLSLVPALVGCLVALT